MQVDDDDGDEDGEMERRWRAEGEEGGERRARGGEEGGRRRRRRGRESGRGDRKWSGAARVDSDSVAKAKSSSLHHEATLFLFHTSSLRLLLHLTTML